MFITVVLFFMITLDGDSKDIVLLNIMKQTFNIL